MLVSLNVIGCNIKPNDNNIVPETTYVEKDSIPIKKEDIKEDEIYFSIIDSTNSLLYLIIDGVAAISGIFCVVLCAKGKKSQYIWGLLNVIGYIIIAFFNKYYGEVMLNALYYLPSQFIGYYLWNKNSNEENGDVKGKKLLFLSH